MATYWENSCSFGLRYVSWYKYLIVSLVFFHLGFWSGNLFLIAPFPDLCLLVPCYHDQHAVYRFCNFIIIDMQYTAFVINNCTCYNVEHTAFVIYNSQYILSL